MMRKLLLTVLAIALSVSAQQRPKDTSICDFYAQAALGASNATTQKTLLTLLVNTAVIGNYSNASVSAVPGILAPNATYNNTKVNLLPFFDGSLASSNRGGKGGKAVNFLDDGGAAPLMLNEPSNGTTSNQYHLLTHLYSFFGALLGCSDIGSHAGIPSYGGVTSMYEVHKFMALDAFQVGYFIEQVGLSAVSFGVQDADVQYVGNALQMYFGRSCSPPTDVLPDQKKELQAVCVAKNCPMDPNPTCDAYEKVVEPKKAKKHGSSTDSDGSSSTGSGGTSSTGSGSGSSTSSTSESMAKQLEVSLCSMFALFAALLVLCA